MPVYLLLLRHRRQREIRPEGWVSSHIARDYGGADNHTDRIVTVLSLAAEAHLQQV